MDVSGALILLAARAMALLPGAESSALPLPSGTHAPGAWAVRQQCSAFPTPTTQASQLVVATQVFAAPLPREESVSRRTLSSSLDGN